MSASAADSGGDGAPPAATADVVVSVIVPVFNRPRQLELALGSALEQRISGLPPEAVEVVVVDDGSSQPPDVRDAGSRVRLVTLECNRGPSAARNAGIKAARGSLVAFLDSDDVWLPGKLERQLGLLRSVEAAGSTSPVAVSCGFYHPQRSTGRLQARRPRGAVEVAEFASGCWYCPGSTVLLRRSAFELAGPFDETLRRLEDLEWFVRFGRCGGTLVINPEFEAVIAPSRSAGSLLIKESAARIRQAFGPGGDSELSGAAWTALDGYLWFELGAALLDEGQHVRATAAFVRAFARAPRLAQATTLFGERFDRCPDDIQALYELMSAYRT